MCVCVCECDMEYCAVLFSSRVYVLEVGHLYGIYVCIEKLFTRTAYMGLPISKLLTYEVVECAMNGMSLI